MSSHPTFERERARQIAIELRQAGDHLKADELDRLLVQVDSGDAYVKMLGLARQCEASLDLKAVWDAGYVNDLPDASFLYVAPGGGKDDSGRTTPRSLRLFPVRDASGKMDVAHVRNALARIPQANLPQAVKDAATSRARGLLSGTRIVSAAA